MRAAAGAAIVAALLPFAALAQPVTGNVAVLQGLDKITAKVRPLEARIGEALRFGTLEIIVRACSKRPPEDPPEVSAFLEVTETRGGEPRRIFTGWMFASSPGVSALEHGVYDVWVTDCRDSAPGNSGGRR
jgi:hypothetical protein